MEEESHLEQFRENIVKIPEAFESTPNNWWLSSVKLLSKLDKGLHTLEDSEIIDYYHSQIEYLYSRLRKACHLPSLTENQICAFTDSVIMDSSARMAQIYESDSRELKVHFIPIEQLVELNPERFSLEEVQIREKTAHKLNIKRRNSNTIDTILLPPESKKYRLYHKGGPPRYILDIVAGSPQSMQDSEVPFNDYDMMAYGSAAAKEMALLLGADTEGVEFGGTTPKLDFPLYARSRDTTQNEILLGAEGLFFTDAAYESAKTGRVRLTSEYIANRAIYGIDHTFVEGVKVATPRGQMRCLKALCEGKALSFFYTPVSSQFDLGIYSLFLAKKWMKKESLPRNLDRMYYILNEMGHVRNGENNIFDTLNRMHREYPFFDFNTQSLNSQELVKWKVKKLIRQLDREYRWKNKLKTTFQIERKDGDLDEKIVSLEKYSQNKEIVKQFPYDRWKQFLKECEQRSLEYTKTAENETLYDYFFGFQQRKGKFDDLPFEGI